MMLSQSEKTNPISKMLKNERKRFFYKRIMKMNHLPAQKKQTQNKANFFKGQNRLPKNLATPVGVGTGGEPLQLQGSLGNIYKQRALSVFLCV